MLTAYLHDHEVCKFESGGAMRFMPDNPLIEERKSLHRLLLDMKQAHDLYAEACPLTLEEVRDFRLISGLGDILLAARMGRDNEVRFNTWQYNYERTGVTWGHYFETDYEGANRFLSPSRGVTRIS